jgi:amino acid permease-like protein
MANSILGAGIFGLPALLAARLGGYSPLSCIVAGCGALIIAACIAEISSRFETTGGLYLYGREALGRFPGLLIAWLILLTRIAAPAAAADLFANYLGQFFPSLHGKLPEICLIGALIGHLALLNYLGVKTGKTVSDIFTAVKVGLLAVFIVAGLAIPMLHPQLRVPLHLGATTPQGWFEALLLLVFGYGGFEGALIVGGESRNPKRDMPFALLSALVLQVFLYTSVVYVVLSTLPNAGASLRPLADAARSFLGGWGATAQREFAAFNAHYFFPRRTRRLSRIFRAHSCAIPHSAYFNSGLLARRFRIRGQRRFSLECHSFCRHPPRRVRWNGHRAAHVEKKERPRSVQPAVSLAVRRRRAGDRLGSAQPYRIR